MKNLKLIFEHMERNSAEHLRNVIKLNQDIEEKIEQIDENREDNMDGLDKFEKLCYNINKEYN